MNSIIERFNALRWHDSKLLGLSLYRTNSEEQIRISLLLRGEGRVLKPTDIVFLGSTYIDLEIDLEGKCACADDIADAECQTSSEWIDGLKKRNPYDSFEGYMHFAIELIPPGGKINILSKDFVLESIARGARSGQ